MTNGLDVVAPPRFEDSVSDDATAGISTAREDDSRSTDESTVFRSAGWLFATTIVTSGAGFAFWSLAAHILPKRAIGASGAAISAVQLLGTVGMLGLGTLLVGELSKRREDPRSLLTTGVLLSGGAGGLLGLAFVLAMRIVAPSAAIVPHRLLGNIAFVAVVAATSALFVLDDSTVGLRAPAIQLWRNLAFSLLKLGFLPLAVVVAGLQAESGVLWAWLAGALVSAALVVRPLARQVGGPLRTPQRGLISRHAKSAWSHHVLNLTTAAPRYALPVLVTAFLTPAVNADFYISVLLIGFAYIVPVHLSTALFAVGARDHGTLARSIRRVNRALVAVGLASGLIFWLGGPLLLRLFGPDYGGASSVLAILGAVTMFGGVKPVYVAACRVNGDLGRAALVTSIAGLAELGAPLVALLAGGGITTVAVAWAGTMVVEAALLWPIVALSAGPSTKRLRLPAIGWLAPETVKTGASSRPVKTPLVPGLDAVRRALGAIPPMGRGWLIRGNVLPAALVAVTAGTILIGSAYNAGRANHHWAIVMLWAGQVISFSAIAAAAVDKRLSVNERFFLIVIQAAQQSFVRWMYSPLFFTFFDEAQHWRSSADILATHHLFHANPMLVVSPVFPGLEELTTALVSVGHLSLRAAALVEGLVVHVALAAAVFVLFRRVTPHARVAAIGTVLFAVNPLHAGFDTMYVYEGPALVFAVASLALVLSAHRMSAGEAAAAVASLAGVIVTHHVTAAVTIAELFALGVLLAVQRELSVTARRALTFGVGAAMLAALWVVGVASSVLSYLSAPVESVVSGILNIGASKGTVPLPTAKGSAIVSMVTITGALVMVVLIVVGVVQIARSSDLGPRRSIARAFAVLALGYFVVLAIRAFAADGPELAGRLLTFVSLFTAVVAAFAVARLASYRRAGAAVAVASMTAVFAGGVTSGWPAPWELVPGTFRVAAFESGMDRQNLAAALWFGKHVGANKRIACDFSSCSLLGAYAHEYSIDNAPTLYGAPTLTPQVIHTIQYYGVQYLFIDRRMSKQRATTGHYFWAGPQAAQQRLPIAPSALSKYNNLVGISLIYDSGTIAIYDVRELLHG